MPSALQKTSANHRRERHDVTPVRKPLDKVIVSETMGVRVMSGIEVLGGYAIRAAVRLVSKGLESVTPFLMSFTSYLQIAENKEPTSGLEPLTCSLRVSHRVLQGRARACTYRISKPFSLHRFALCCTVLRSRWCQSGVNITLVSAER